MIFLLLPMQRDIGNTSKMYASAFFEKMNFDSITVNPYMGKDSVTPFLDFENKWAIVLALTSNNGALDFQEIKDESDVAIFEKVLSVSKGWGTDNNLMYVIGATRSEYFTKVRQILIIFIIPMLQEEV